MSQHNQPRSEIARDLVLAAILALTAVGVILLKPPGGGFEVAEKVELDVGARYLEPSNPARATGLVAEVLGVPVYDFGQGFGHRLPNLISQVTASPTVLLNDVLDVDQTRWLRLFTSLTLLFFTVFSVSRSWSIARGRATSACFAILPAVFTYVVHNDWFFQADQVCGLAILLLVPLSKCWHVASSEPHVEAPPGLMLALSSAGWCLYLMGHPDWWPLALWWLPVQVWFLVVKVRPRLGWIPVVLHLLVVAVMGLPQVIEIVGQDWTGGRPYETQSTSSLFLDLSSGGAFWTSIGAVRRSLTALVLMPLPYLVYATGVNVEIPTLGSGANGAPRDLVLPILAVISLVGSLPVSLSEAQRRLRSIVRAEVCAVFAGLMFHDNLGRLSHWLSPGITHQTGDALAPVLVVWCLFVWGVLRRPRSLRSRALRLIAAGSIVSIAAQSMLFYGDVRRLRFPEHGTGDLEASSMFGAPGERIAVLENDPSTSQDLATGLRILTGYRHPAEILREGHPLLWGVPWGRATGTLRPIDEQRRFNGEIDLSIEDCGDTQFDFAAVGTVVEVETIGGLSRRCRDRLGALFHSSLRMRSVYRSEAKTKEESTHSELGLLVTTLREFDSFWLVDDGAMQSEPDCEILRPQTSCLSGRGIVRVHVSPLPPLRVETGNDVRYRFVRPGELAGTLLVPLNFDSALKVNLTDRDRDQPTLSTSNYRGLLAVEVPSDVGQGELSIHVQPDLLMWSRTLATWAALTTIVLVLRLSLGRLRSIRLPWTRSGSSPQRP